MRPTTPTQTAELKGSIFAKYVSGLRDRAMFEQVRAAVPRATQELMDSPPLAISWVSADHPRHVLDAFEAQRGLEEVRKLGSEALQNGLFQIFKPLLSGVARTAGSSPHALFARMPSVLTAIARGYEISYRELGPRTGEINVRSRGVVESRASLSAGWEPGFAVTFELALCKDGRVRLHHFEPQVSDTISSFHAFWTEA